MILKKLADHVVIDNPLCGTIHNILRKSDFEGVNVATAIDIRPTTAHFHKTFEEIYLMLDGTLTLALHDPADNSTREVKLEANELCLIPKGLHHVIKSASPTNRLCIITHPHFDPADEIPSNVL
jgi:mannose-6-phosphate isomerase-like protein (cupin superfamily)